MTERKNRNLGKRARVEADREAPAGSPENPTELRFPVAIRRAGAPRILRASGRRSARSAPAFATRKSATSARQKSKPKSTAAAAKKGKRASDRRDEVRTPTGTFYAKRTAGGRFKEMDEKGRSLAADRRKKAKKRVGSGYGDQGDRSAKKK